jgi:hypothetical protein
VLGIDFTSAPGRRKPITCLSCVLEGNVLRATRLEKWETFGEFDDTLQMDGPWIAGIDFPFGQARKFITTIGWPLSLHDYVSHAHGLGRVGFRNALDAYRAQRPKGDREHRRATDVAAGAISPQKLYGVPVGMMFFEGAPRLIQAGVTIPRLQLGDQSRIVVEAYPGVLARRHIGTRSYKNDGKAKQTELHLSARYELFSRITSGSCLKDYGLSIEATDTLAFDPTGDSIDALLCAIQAGWSWSLRDSGFGAPNEVDPLEGWIADPNASRSYGSI